MLDGSAGTVSGCVGGVEVRGHDSAPWRDLDQRFRAIARRRGALDHEELGLIREAISCALWRELGMVSIREYLEHVMGYGPGVAWERVRVAEALDAMPLLEAALESGELSYSAVRAISRIATRKTERDWVEACRGKNVRQIEELLAEREPGDRPESPRNPDLRLKELRFKVLTHVEAIVRQCRVTLEGQMGERVDETQLLEAMGLAFLRGGGVRATRIDDGEGAKTASADRSTARATAPYHISISLCPACRVARQHGAGVDFAIAPAAFERAACDARWLGNVDGERARAVQDVTPAVRELVLARDRHRCRVPGCRSAQNIEVHHIVHRAAGGSHEPANLIALCGGHHATHHAGELIVRGTAEQLEVIRAAELPVETRHLDAAQQRGDAQRADADEPAHSPAETLHVETPQQRGDAQRADADEPAHAPAETLHVETPQQRGDAQRPDAGEPAREPAETLHVETPQQRLGAQRPAATQQRVGAPHPAEHPAEHPAAAQPLPPFVHPVQDPAPGVWGTDVGVLRALATSALKNLGYHKEIAVRAVRDALEADSAHDLDSLIRAALQRCSR